MTSYDWSRFQRKIYINAPLSKIFDLWTQPELLTTWFIKKAIYTKVDGSVRGSYEQVVAGDRYHWEWHQDLTAKGQVLKVEKNKLFQFTFGDKEKGSDEKVVVSVDFNQDGENSYFTLTQANMGGSELDQAYYHLSCNMGWSFFMTNMKALLEHEIDLRELDPKRAYETRAVSL